MRMRVQGPPVITNLALANPSGGGYLPGLQFHIRFDCAIYVPPGNFTQSVIDSLFSFSTPLGTVCGHCRGDYCSNQSICSHARRTAPDILYCYDTAGVNYTGWVDQAAPDKIVINITNIFAAGGYKYDYQSMVITVNGIQDANQSYTTMGHVASAAADPGIISDNWPSFPTPTPPFIVGFRAVNRANDYDIANGDAVDVEFNRPTNWGVANRSYSDVSQLAWAVPLNLSAGSNVTASWGSSCTGLWVNSRTLRIIIQDVSGNTARPGHTRVYIDGAHGLKDERNVSAVVDALSGNMTGGYVAKVLGQIWALDLVDNLNFANGDGFDIHFQIAMPFTASTVASQAQLDEWFTFSPSIGTSYSGLWTSEYNLQVTVTNTAGAAATLATLRVIGNPTTTLQDANKLSDYVKETSNYLENSWATGASK